MLEFRDAPGLLAFGFADTDLSFLRGTGDLHLFVAVGSSNADFAELFLFGDVAAGLLNRFGSSLLADGRDVAGFVGDVRNVDVDQDQANLPQFGLQ